MLHPEAYGLTALSQKGVMRPLAAGQGLATDNKQNKKRQGMDKLDRIYALHRLLAGRRTPVPLRDLMAHLGHCSRATALRLIAEFRDRLGAPIEYDRERGGYWYAPTVPAERYELPGVWFSACELQALMRLRSFVEKFAPGLQDAHLAALWSRLERMASPAEMGNMRCTCHTAAQDG